MARPLLLASTSAIRRHVLTEAGIGVTALAARVDEEAIRQALLAEGASPQDVADTLAESKARKIADKHPQDLVLGCDQVLDFDRKIITKAESLDQVRAQLLMLRGKTHRLLSAAVLYDQGRPIWRHVATARLTMRDFSDSYLDGYLARNWPDVSDSVGGYKLEREGSRLFATIEGDFFTILGLPLLPLMAYLGLRGFIDA